MRAIFLDEPETEVYPLEEAEAVLGRLRRGDARGAAVLLID
jgi:hypothetical protein